MNKILLSTLVLLSVYNMYGQSDIKLDSLVTESYTTTTSDWSSLAKEFYQYDTDERLATHTSCSWNAGEQTWQNNIQRTYHYDDNGNNTIYEAFNWDNVNDVWINSSRIERTFDGENIIELLSFNWDNVAQNWVNNNRKDFVYNTNGQLIEDTSFNWTGGAWVESRYNQYLYDSNQNNTSTIVQQWDVANMEWDDLFRFENLYDDDKLVQSTSLKWSIAAQEWVGFFRDMFEYNANEQVTVQTTQRWITSSGEWLNYLKDEFTFDAENNKTNITRYDWSEAWIPDTQWNYDYDNTVDYDDMIVPFSATDFRHKRTTFEIQNWDSDIENWVNHRRGIYHYSDVVIDITNAYEVDIRVFPNPTNHIICFDLDKPLPAIVSLFDLQGKLLINSTLNPNHQLTLPNLPDGNYVYLLQYDGKQISGKITVKQ